MLLASAGTASAATTASAPSAYFWQPNGHALGGPQAMPGGTVTVGSQYLAKVTADEHNADLRGATITITGTINGSQFTDPPNEGDATQTNPYVRVFFQGGSAGTDAGSPDGYMGQSWWANGTGSWQCLNGQTTFSLTVTVDPSAGWGDWNGEQASNSPALFSDAASHVRNLGLSFGGGWFSENGVTGPGSLTITGFSVIPKS
jgi:hypothetical protein